MMVFVVVVVLFLFSVIKNNKNVLIVIELLNSRHFCTQENVNLCMSTCYCYVIEKRVKENAKEIKKRIKV